MIVYSAMLSLASLVVVLLSGYLLILVARLIHNGTSAAIGFDVILAFHLLAIAAIIMAMTSRIILKGHDTRNRVWLVVAIAGAVVELLFLSLNISRIVWSFSPGQS